MKVDNRVTGKTKIAGVIGNPIEHSVSPQLHNTISKYLGVDLIYVPFRVEAGDIEDAVKGLKALNVIGFNVTIPYKKEVIKYLDENSKQALLMGAVNTVKNINGRLYGYNTDAEGFSRSFKEETGIGFAEKRVFIIGAGGAARAIAVKVAFEGAKEIFIANRTTSKANEIADIINYNISRIVETCSIKDRMTEDIFQNCDIIINTTSVGMYPETEISPLDGTGLAFSRGHIVYDVIYNPAKTKFLKDAEKAGCKTVNGMGMLFYQGINAYEIWTGIKLSSEITRKVFESIKDILPC